MSEQTQPMKMTRQELTELAKLADEELRSAIGKKIEVRTALLEREREIMAQMMPLVDDEFVIKARIRARENAGLPHVEWDAVLEMLTEEMSPMEQEYHGLEAELAALGLTPELESFVTLKPKPKEWSEEPEVPAESRPVIKATATVSKQLQEDLADAKKSKVEKEARRREKKAVRQAENQRKRL